MRASRPEKSTHTIDLNYETNGTGCWNIGFSVIVVTLNSLPILSPETDITTTKYRIVPYRPLPDFPVTPRQLLQGSSTRSAFPPKIFHQTMKNLLVHISAEIYSQIFIMNFTNGSLCDGVGNNYSNVESPATQYEGGLLTDPIKASSTSTTAFSSPSPESKTKSSWTSVSPQRLSSSKIDKSDSHRPPQRLISNGPPGDLKVPEMGEACEELVLAFYGVSFKRLMRLRQGLKELYVSGLENALEGEKRGAMEEANVGKIGTEFEMGSQIGAIAVDDGPVLVIRFSMQKHEKNIPQEERSIDLSSRKDHRAASKHLEPSGKGAHPSIPTTDQTVLVWDKSISLMIAEMSENEQPNQPGRKYPATPFHMLPGYWILILMLSLLTDQSMPTIELMNIWKICDSAQRYQIKGDPTVREKVTILDHRNQNPACLKVRTRNKATTLEHLVGETLQTSYIFSEVFIASVTLFGCRARLTERPPDSQLAWMTIAGHVQRKRLIPELGYGHGLGLPESLVTLPQTPIRTTIYEPAGPQDLRTLSAMRKWVSSVLVAETTALQISEKGFVKEAGPNYDKEFRSAIENINLRDHRDSVQTSLPNLAVLIFKMSFCRRGIRYLTLLHGEKDNHHLVHKGCRINSKLDSSRLHIPHDPSFLTSINTLLLSSSLQAAPFSTLFTPLLLDIKRVEVKTLNNDQRASGGAVEQLVAAVQVHFSLASVLRLSKYLLEKNGSRAEEIEFVKMDAYRYRATLTPIFITTITARIILATLFGITRSIVHWALFRFVRANTGTLLREEILKSNKEKLQAATTQISCLITLIYGAGGLLTLTLGIAQKSNIIPFTDYP
ncbi:uncharacterized protein BDR25DRAFT_360963 [Lindgomyces ingoldianus]|uniref:Uncharacterized protein n=1 Tax=Lindgomyces ingoldianus TaxID=673940 RepID=A0ACB6QDK9_9PLEO|nr:uncharacterized protein BDR25DRAFT_360963 [Lindgomyces ingoldianus]KAF2465058.1 hypothetical protein BDR25DRAFT_360963 [Lindgomyces ingoldianus]